MSPVKSSAQSFAYVLPRPRLVNPMTIFVQRLPLPLEPSVCARSAKNYEESCGEKESEEKPGGGAGGRAPLGGTTLLVQFDAGVAVSIREAARRFGR